MGVGGCVGASQHTGMSAGCGSKRKLRCRVTNATPAPPLLLPVRPQEIAALTVRQEQLQRQTEAVERRRGTLTEQIAGLKQVGFTEGGGGGGGVASPS